MSSISKPAVLDIAQQVGVRLDFNGPWVRKAGASNWLRYRQMYNRLHYQRRIGSRLRKDGEA